MMLHSRPSKGLSVVAGGWLKLTPVALCRLMSCLSDCTLGCACRYALNTAGAAARIFTSIQENAGAAMLRGAIISECRQGWASPGAAALKVLAARLQGCACSEARGAGRGALPVLQLKASPRLLHTPSHEYQPCWMLPQAQRSTPSWRCRLSSMAAVRAKQSAARGKRHKVHPWASGWRFSAGQRSRAMYAGRSPEGPSFMRFCA